MLFFPPGDYTLKIDLGDFEKNSCYAQYKDFKVGDEKVTRFSHKQHPQINQSQWK